MTIVFLMATTKLFSSKIEISLKEFFLQPQIDFLLKQTIQKEFFMQILNFCLHNVVLDLQKLDFFHFPGKRFSNRLKTFMFLYGMFIYALINV